MRWLIVVFFATPAVADLRVGVHAGGGIDAGLMQGEPRPDGIAEAGLAVDTCATSWCLGGILEAVGRQSEATLIAEELKLDVIARYRFPNRPGKLRGTLGFGAGIRNIAVPANERRPASSVRGYDLLRMESELEITRVGRVSIDIYFAWTFGIYKDEMLGERFGDMAYPKQDVSTMTNAYVIGLRTAFSP